LASAKSVSGINPPQEQAELKRTDLYLYFAAKMYPKSEQPGGQLPFAEAVIQHGWQHPYFPNRDRPCHYIRSAIAQHTLRQDCPLPVKVASNT
jgi:hypothetical protein